MSKSSKSRGRGRTVDKWALKSLYTIQSPEDIDFGSDKGAIVGETVASDPDLIIGRILEVPLSDLTQKFSLIHIKLLFKVVEVSGTSAKTKFFGHSYAHDFVRSLVKRRRTRIDWIGNVKTKDDKELRLTVTSLTLRRAKTSRKHSIRLETQDIVNKLANEMNFNEFVSYMLRGDMSHELYEANRKIYPLAQVEVQKSKVLTKFV
ncbi:MAG: 30S ribosomal protein S3ae [Candidatus Hodarchaeales archaeon]|jgi:small subunit ribosomal protein S3Ae